MKFKKVNKTKKPLKRFKLHKEAFYFCINYKSYSGIKFSINHVLSIYANTPHPYASSCWRFSTLSGHTRFRIYEYTRI